MQIREFKNAAGRPMVEFLRHTYDKERGRGVARRLGRFQVDIIRSAADLAVRRKFTPEEDEQFEEWWSPHQAKLDEADRRRSNAAKAQRQASILPNLEQAISALEAALKAGEGIDAEAVRSLADRLKRTLKASGVVRPMKSPRGYFAVEDNRQTDIEDHIAAAHARADLTTESQHHWAAGRPT